MRIRNIVTDLALRIGNIVTDLDLPIGTIVTETLLCTQQIYISLVVKQCNGPEVVPGQASTWEHLDYVLFVSYVFKSYNFIYISLISSFIKEGTLARNNVTGFGRIQA